MSDEIEATEDATEIFWLDINESSVEAPDEFAAELQDIRTLDGLGSVTKRKFTRMENKLEKKLQGLDEAQSKRLEDHVITGYNAFEVVAPPYNLTYLAKLYELSSTHMSAVDAKVYNIVGLGYDFIESPRKKAQLEKTKGEKALKNARRRLQIEKIDLTEKLENMNEEDTLTETLIKAYTDLESTGNGYIEIGRIAKGPREGEIGYIGHVPSQSVRVRRSRDGFVQIIADRAVFFRNFGDTKTTNPLGGDSNPNELIHLKTYTPTNGFYGVPKIVSAKTAVAGNEFAAKYNLDYFENKAVPRYIITTKGVTLGGGVRNKLLEFFQTGLKGKNHRSVYIPLPADSGDKKVEFKMEAVENGIQDSSFDNYRKANLADILMAHRVPISKVSTAEGTALAAARDADKTFKEQVCRPAQQNLEKKLNKIILEFTKDILFKFNELALSDEDVQSQIDERMLRMQVLTPNEVRARKGLPGRDGGDKVVELKPQQAADQRANAGKTRARDAERSAKATDSKGEGRSAKGDGRTTKLIKSDQSDNRDGVMVALRIDPELAKELAVDGGLAPEELHITMAFLGRVDDYPEGPSDILDQVIEWAEQTAPLSGVISGKGIFLGDMPGGAVTYLSPDVPGLPEARQDLVENYLEDVFDNPNHGYTPHITLIYGDKLAEINVRKEALKFDSVSLYWGDARADVPFSGSVD